MNPELTAEDWLKMSRFVDDARWLLDMIRSACRKHNHPMAYQIVCPYCERITELLGE